MRQVLPDIGVNPDYGMKESPKMRTKSVGFGDGYIQRRPDGLNSTRRSWSLSWSNLNRDQRDTLYSFLVDKQGVETFIWNVAGEDEAYQVLATKPSWSADDYEIYSVTATFTEDFTP